MITTSYHYPGDPVEKVYLMFGGEFEKANPDREIVITSFGETPDQHIPVTEVVCDSCNALVQPTDPCAVTDSRLYCWECFNEWVKPYLVKEDR